jgi:hypothetical protein
MASVGIYSSNRKQKYGGDQKNELYDLYFLFVTLFNTGSLSLLTASASLLVARQCTAHYIGVRTGCNRK